MAAGERAVRYAVVGAGGFAASHLRRILQHGPDLGCELTAVAIRPQDRRGGQVEQFAARGVEVFDEAGEMFRRLAGRVDGVFIPTGIHTHCELTCAALRAGHHVYVEKPPAATVQEVDRMLRAVAESGRMCCLGFQAIFGRSINLIKARVVSGALGEVRRLRCWAFWPRAEEYYARNEWAGRLKVGDAWVLDGPSNNALSHQIANMLYLASPQPRSFATPRAVRAELYRCRSGPSEDTSAVEILTEEGPRAYFLASDCVSGPQAGPWIEMDCSEATVRWGAGGRGEIRYADGRAEAFCDDGAAAPLAALANFTEAVRAGQAGLLKCDLTMGRAFTLVVNGAFESSGRVHPIPDRFVGHSRDPAGAASSGSVGPHPVIEGINEVIARCAAEGALYSDLGCEWAVPTEPFDLSSYAEFPQRFRP